MDWLVNPFGRSDSSGPLLPPDFPSGQQQRGVSPASERSRWRQGRCITWKTRGLVGFVFSRQRNREFKLKYLKKLLDHNDVIYLQEVYGKDEFLQAVQVLGPRFRLFGTFLPDNENGEGSAVCIHTDLLPEKAIVTHVVTCNGRDHLVNIRTGRHSLVMSMSILNLNLP